MANNHVQEKNVTEVPVSTPTDATREPSLAPSNDDSQADHDMDSHGNDIGQVSLKGLLGSSNVDSNGPIDREQEERNISAEIEANIGVLQDEIWRELTKKTRAKVSVSLPYLPFLSLAFNPCHIKPFPFVPKVGHPKAIPDSFRRAYSFTAVIGGHEAV